MSIPSQVSRPSYPSRLVHRIAPALSGLIQATHTTAALRQLLRFGNFLLGLGASRPHLLSAEVKAARSLIYRQEPIICDVGANIGHWSQIMRTHLPGGTLYLFEPQATCCQVIASLHLSNAIIIPAAVGETPGTLTLYTHREFDDMASFYQQPQSEGLPLDSRQTEVPVIALDPWMCENRLPFIDYLKLDIEGHELCALKGATQALSSGKIGALSFEFGCCNLSSHTCLRDLWDLLSPRYHLFIILPNGNLRPLPEYHPELEYYHYVSNFSAVLKNHPYREQPGGNRS